MLLDLLADDNFVQFNKKLAHTLGLKEAIYVNQLLNIVYKATTKNKLINNEFIKLDRKYLFKQTTLAVEDQLKIETKLQRLNLLVKDFDNDDLLKLDVEKLASITITEDEEVIKEIQNRTSIGKLKLDKNTKDNNIITGFSRLINSGNEDIDNAYKRWIEICVKTKGNFLSKEIINKFQQDLYKYTNGNVQLALDVLNVATTYCYRECSWAIKIYEKEKLEKERTTIKGVASKETLSQKIY